MATGPVIVARNLTRRFGQLLAVDRLSLEVFPGEVFGFLGHNGAGKTTTIRLLNGVLSSSEGKAEVLGLDPARDGAALRRRTGVLTETPSLDERLTGRESLQIHADIYHVPRHEIDHRVSEVLEDFELGNRADEKVADYSSGMKQRLALARALLHEPDVLFLDEPTAGLDPLAARRVHNLIGRLTHVEKRTAFICTHNLVEAQRLCDRVAVLEHGRLVALGTPAELARGSGRGLRLELEVAPDSLARAVDITKAVPGAVDPSVLENGIIALAVADREVIPRLVAALTAGGVPIYCITPQEPSLEDIYFALHGEEELA
jgi:ABC-2 type transport system ATP-binding protein